MSHKQHTKKEIRKKAPSWQHQKQKTRDQPKEEKDFNTLKKKKIFPVELILPK